jgi:2-polyprenyl-3-methyl-5-hydroxy-6-metoxy-1,4-benzoquinol methylase
LFRHGGILEWIAAHVEVPPEGRILDVAGETGQLGQQLAGDGASAVIVDLTDAMLAARFPRRSSARCSPPRVARPGARQTGS